MLERDGLFAFGSPPSTAKRIYEADITGATDISALGALGATPIAGGKTLEQATVAQLVGAGIVPVTKTLRVDLAAAGFPHDKAEGMALGPGNTLFVTDDDVGITTGAIGVMIQKLLPPTNVPDFVEVWQFKLK